MFSSAGTATRCITQDELSHYESNGWKSSTADNGQSYSLVKEGGMTRCCLCTIAYFVSCIPFTAITAPINLVDPDDKNAECHRCASSVRNVHVCLYDQFHPCEMDLFKKVVLKEPLAVNESD